MPHAGSPAASSSSRTVLHRGRKFDLEQITLEAPDGSVLRREVVRHPGATVILPILDRGRIILIRNRRPALDREIYELPAGTLEPSEPPEACARRELVEETGYRAASLTPLGRFYTSPGMSDELMWAYAATGLEHVGQQLEEDEHLTVHPIPVARAIRMLDSGEVEDGKTMLTLLLALRKGLIES